MFLVLLLIEIFVMGLNKKDLTHFYEIPFLNKDSLWKSFYFLSL